MARPTGTNLPNGEFTAEEVDRIEAATAEIQRLPFAAGGPILDRNRLSEIQIPPEAHARIREAWNSEPPALYGRIDLAYDVKLHENNADTPTALVEAAVAQWYWPQDSSPASFPPADQFNSIHEQLLAKWKEIHAYVRQPVYFGTTAAKRTS
jgi:glutathionylspermidine synthase